MPNDIFRQKESKGRTLTGVVVSDKMDKTVVVEVSRLRKHPKYKKYFKITKKFKVHDENNIYRCGDKVRIKETKPISKDKRFRVYSRVEE